MPRDATKSLLPTIPVGSSLVQGPLLAVDSTFVAVQSVLPTVPAVCHLAKSLILLACTPVRASCCLPAKSRG
jgi:hypothetical protein